MPIVQFLLSEFILENFELTSIDRPEGIFHVHIEEKNADQNDPERKNLLSKGFFPNITVQDFPIRGHQVLSISSVVDGSIPKPAKSSIGTGHRWLMERE